MVTVNMPLKLISKKHPPTTFPTKEISRKRIVDKGSKQSYTHKQAKLIFLLCWWSEIHVNGHNSKGQKGQRLQYIMVYQNTSTKPNCWPEDAKLQSQASLFWYPSIWPKIKLQHQASLFWYPSIWPMIKLQSQASLFCYPSTWPKIKLQSQASLFWYSSI